MNAKEIKNKNILEIFLKIFYGFLMGISDGIPGYSGGTTLSLLNFYDIFLIKFKNLFIKNSWKKWFDNLLWLLPFLISWGIFLIAFSFLSSFISSNGIGYQIVLFSLFFSFSLFCIPNFFIFKLKNKNNKIKNKKDILYLIPLFLSLLITLSIGIGVFFNGGISLNKENGETKIFFNIKLLLILFMCFLSGYCILIPGISGSMILFLSNTYKDIYWIALQNPLNNIFVILLIFLFIGIGFISSVLTINLLIKKYKKIFVYLSFGFIIGSPIAMILSFFGNKEYLNKFINIFVFYEKELWFLLFVVIIAILLNIILIMIYIKKNKIMINIKEKSALIVVDMQNDFYKNGPLGTKNQGSVLKNAIKIINCFRKNNCPIIFSKDYHPINHISFKEWPIHCVENTIGSNFIDSIELRDSDLIICKGTKKNIDNFSPFYNGKKETKLKKFLLTNDIKNLYIIGFYGDICVKHTAIDALKFGFLVYLISSGIKSFDDNFDIKKIDKNINII